MKEEEIDNRIERVVKSVAAKKAEMTRWKVEHNIYRRGTRRRWGFYSISTAACVVVAIGVGIHFMTTFRHGDMSTGVSSEVIYRGGSSELEEIVSLINANKNAEAITRIDLLMGDTILSHDMTDQRRKYIREVQAVQRYELEWIKINALVNLGQKDEAIELLKSYIKKDGEYNGKAEIMLNALSK